MSGNRSNQRPHRSGGSASPVTTSHFRPGSAGTSPVTSHESSAARSSDGTTSRIVTPSFGMVANSRSGSTAVSRPTTRVVPPTSSVVSICQTEMSKVTGALCTSLSTEDTSRSSALHSRWFTMPRRCTMAPLGLPVDPDVKITYARSSAAPRAGASAFGASSAPSSTTTSTGLPAASTISAASARWASSTTRRVAPLSVSSAAMRVTGAATSSGT